MECYALNIRGKLNICQEFFDGIGNENKMMEFPLHTHFPWLKRKHNVKSAKKKHTPVAERALGTRVIREICK